MPTAVSIASSAAFLAEVEKLERHYRASVIRHWAMKVRQCGRESVGSRELNLILPCCCNVGCVKIPPNTPFGAQLMRTRPRQVVVTRLPCCECAP